MRQKDPMCISNGDIDIRRLPSSGSLEAFVAAARSGSLQQASLDLRLSVSAISRRIQKLEQMLARSLFVRHGNEFRLSDDGRRLFEAIEKPLEEIICALDAHWSDPEDRLVVGVPSAFASAWLIPRLAHFRESHPDLQLEIDTSGSPLKKLGSSLDVIIFFANEKTSSLGCKTLRPQGAFTVAKQGVVDPLRGLQANLRTTPLLVHSGLPEVQRCWMEALNLPTDFPLTIDPFDDGALLVAAAQSGLGIALVLEDMIEFASDAEGLIRPFGEYVRSPFSYAIASRPANARPKSVERFCSWIVQETRTESTQSLLSAGVA